MKKEACPKMPERILRAVLILAFGIITSGGVIAGPVQSAGKMVFADSNTLFVADWRADEIHALHLASLTPGVPKPFNLKDISSPIAAALHTAPDKLRFEDLAFRPGAELAYLTLMVVSGNEIPRPALVTIDAAGKVADINLEQFPQTSVKIKDPPPAEARFWCDVPEASYIVTDMVFHDGRLYVAGLSSGSFASTLRVYDFPFSGNAAATSIEMYHAVHNQMETRAPIRTMAIVQLNGEPTLVAAYTCTPLVTIPLKALKDGAHVIGKTIAELGWGSAPVDLVSFDAGQGPMLLLLNSHKSADLMSVQTIAEASAQPGLTTPIKWPDEPLEGLKATYIPISGIADLDNQDNQFFGALRRNEASGVMELVSIRKGAFLRLSDFINEYDFADYAYPTNDTWHQVHQMLRTDEGYPDLAQRAALK